MSGGMFSTCESPVNHLFDTIESVLRKVYFGQEISLSEQRAIDQSCRQWDEVKCQKRGCPHRGDTCRFLGVNLDWVRCLGYPDLCSLLHAQKIPKSFDALRAEWARRPGHYNP